MILKVKAGKNIWGYFEGDNIIQKEIDLTNTDANQHSEVVFFLLEGTKMNNKESNWTNGLSIRVLKENKIIKRIITNRATYLMSDLGKTVDKLF